MTAIAMTANNSRMQAIEGIPSNSGDAYKISEATA
jgi:hypothetical protein